MKKTPQDPHASLEQLNAAAIARVPEDDKLTSANEAALLAHRKRAELGRKQRQRDLAKREERHKKAAVARGARAAIITSPKGDKA
jgi:hypothetical protein